MPYGYQTTRAVLQKNGNVEFAMDKHICQKLLPIIYVAKVRRSNVVLNYFFVAVYR